MRTYIWSAALLKGKQWRHISIYYNEQRIFFFKSILGFEKVKIHPHLPTFIDVDLFRRSPVNLGINNFGGLYIFNPLELL